ncbi:MAG TPA: 4-alpha-glucanotransferase [Trebonia sp.]|nr:4-alpha-glucanotransferase [Trebonia sp.]
MSYGDLRDRAAAMGVEVTYWDWSGRQTIVSDETLAAIVSALGDTALGDTALGDAPPAGRAQPTGNGRLLDAIAPVPAKRSWGFTVQLYSLRSRGSWGHGDLRDLADLARWSARDLGADFVLINPLHAAEPLPPVSPSPYLPMSRRFISPLYLRIEDIPEYQHLPQSERSDLSVLAQPLRDANGTPELIDRDAVWTVKRAALEVIRQVPLSPARQESLDEFKALRGGALRDWAAWCAIAELHGPDYRAWPAALRDPSAAEVTVLRADLARQAEFHAWVQWLVAEQVAAAQRAAKDAGMEIGVIHDLAVGSHPGGADAWAGRDVFARGISVGAPPDGFNQRGQDWSLPPWHPGHLAAKGYEPLRDLIGATIRHAGGIRMDHVMGLSRLWWIPAGMSPAQGAYVHYKTDASLGLLAAEASESGAIAIGEDLGTVERWLRDALSARGVLGTSMLWFERGWSNEPLAPRWWRRNALVTVSTHDMPPAAAFLTGEQVTERALLGLLTRPVERERAEADRLVADWLRALAGQGLLKAELDQRPDLDAFTAALYGYLARTPALLVGVSLAEAVGERRSQNVPGTTTEYPNWRIPLGGPTGSPVLVEDLPDVPLLQAVVRAVSGK